MIEIEKTEAADVFLDGVATGAETGVNTGLDSGAAGITPHVTVICPISISQLPKLNLTVNVPAGTAKVVPLLVATTAFSELTAVILAGTYLLTPVILYLALSSLLHVG